jgi:hypothetical protein
MASCIATQKIGDKKLRGSLERTDKKYEQAIAEAARAEILLPAARGALEAVGPMDRTYKFTQAAIGDEVDVQTRRKMYDLKLDQFGPYAMDYSRSGRHLLLAGSMGHVALLNAHTFRLQTEFHLKETVRDVTFLHNNSMFAVAQKQYAYIYDAMGVELHCLRNHVEPTRLEFLPYHFLLVSAVRALSRSREITCNSFIHPSTCIRLHVSARVCLFSLEHTRLFFFADSIAIRQFSRHSPLLLLNRARRVSSSTRTCPPAS